jgi:hypothetical protein
MTRFALLLVITFGCMVALPVFAQSDSVWVTVQDNAALRAGPGRTWERLAVLPFGQTYEATGRTIDGHWIQIAYPSSLEGGARTEFTRDGVTYGWVSSALLVWTGNVLSLRIDGVSGLGGALPDLGVTTARAQGPLLLLSPDSEVFQGVYGPAVRVPSPTPTIVQVEATGRIGTAGSGAVWLQFKIGGQYYWISLASPPRGYLSLPDASYLFPYSRLTALLQRNLSVMQSVVGDIGGRWDRLHASGAASCNQIPPDVLVLGFTDADLTREPVFAPVGAALTNAQAQINQALSAFRRVCAAPAQRVEPGTITEALTQIAEAERNLNLANALLLPLQRRDPIAGAP